MTGQPIGGHRSSAGSATLIAMPEPRETTSAHRSPRADLAIRIATTFAVFTILGFLAVLLLRGGPASPLRSASIDCGDVGALSDEGRTLKILAPDGYSRQSIECVLERVGAPTDVLDRIRAQSTTPQTATWGDLTAWWRYHPGGFDLILHQM